MKVNIHRCCEMAASGSRSKRFATQTMGGKSHPKTLTRRCLGIASWIVPGAILALLPKCPACLVAYVAVATGLGLSFSTATYLRTSLLILCIASLVCLGLKYLYRFAAVKKLLLKAKAHLPATRIPDAELRLVTRWLHATFKKCHCHQHNKPPEVKSL